MRLVYIANEINGTTGLERMISAQVNYFIQEYSYDVDLVLIEQKKEHKDKTFFEIDSRIPFHYIQSNKGPRKNYKRLIKTLNHTLSKLNPDVVMVCIDDIAWLYLPYVLKRNYKIVYQRHSTKDINLNRYYKDIKTKLINSIKSKIILFGGRCYDKFVVLTEGHKQDWKYVKNLEVIGNPIVLETEGLKAKLDNNIVIAIGRHDPVKGFDMLLKSWQKVITSYPNWKLRIIGRKTTIIDLKNEAQILNISSNVEFLESTKDITQEYLNASILVCSSVMEGFALTIIEAMSLGVPAVSFDCPHGPRAIIKNGEDGILVPPKNIDELAQSIQYLIKEEQVRKDMGKKAQINVQRFAKPNIMKLWKELLENVVQD